MGPLKGGFQKVRGISACKKAFPSAITKGKEGNDTPLLRESLDRQTSQMEVWSAAGEADRIPGTGLQQPPNQSLTEGQSWRQLTTESSFCEVEREREEEAFS